MSVSVTWPPERGEVIDATAGKDYQAPDFRRYAKRSQAKNAIDCHCSMVLSATVANAPFSLRFESALRAKQFRRKAEHDRTCHREQLRSDTRVRTEPRQSR